MWGLGQRISQNMAIKHIPVVEYNKLEFTANNCVIFQNDVRILSLKPLQAKTIMFLNMVAKKM